MSPRTKQNIEKSIQRFEETMAQDAERTRDRSNFSLPLSDKSDDEHIPKRVIDLDVENLNAFREKDLMEEVTLIDTEMANRIEADIPSRPHCGHSCAAIAYPISHPLETQKITTTRLL